MARSEHRLMPASLSKKTSGPQLEHPLAINATFRCASSERRISAP